MKGTKKVVSFTSKEERYGKVVEILQRSDVVGKEKLILIYIYSRQADDEKPYGDPFAEVKVGYAQVPLSQISEQLGQGFTDERRLSKTLQDLEKRHWLKVKKKKGQSNSYRVLFPHKKAENHGQG